jgi:hypothetical protein
VHFSFNHVQSAVYWSNDDLTCVWFKILECHSVCCTQCVSNYYVSINTPYIICRHSIVCAIDHSQA